MSEKLNIQNIGYTANNNPKRAIRSGEEFEGILPAPDWQEEIVKRNADVSQTVKEMQKLIKKSAWQTKELSKLLSGKDIYTTSKNIWNFLFSHFKYKEDDEGQEQLRTPALSWYLRRSRGIDCDDFSIFAGTILYNLKIPFYLRIARYDGKTYFQHVYVIIPLVNKRYITIDGVLDEFDAEKETAETKDFLVMENNNSNKLSGIDVSVLSGNEDETLNELAGIIFGVDFDGLDEPDNSNNMEGLEREPSEEEILGAIYNHLQRTRNAIRKYPQIVNAVEDSETLGEMLDYGLQYWNTDKRDLALGILEEREDQLNKLNGLENSPDGFEETTVFYGIEGLGGVSALGKAKAKKTFFKNVKKAVQKTKQKTKAVAQKTKQKVKTKVQKIKKAVVKNNPVSVAARAGMLVAMKTNLFKIAESLKWGYLTESEAMQNGFDMPEWRNVKAQLQKAENLFVDKLKGNPENFKKAILTGRAGGLNGISEDLGIVTAAAAGASVTAAMPFIKKIGEFAKAINLKKLVGKVKAKRLAKNKKKAETMPEAKEDAETALPESGDSSSENKSESGGSEKSESGEKSGEEKGEESENRTANKSNPSSDGDSSGGESQSSSRTANKSSGSGENTDSSSDNSEGGGSNLPAINEEKKPSINSDGSGEENSLTKITDWVKENPGKSALIVGGLVLAFSSGARKAIGLGSVRGNYKKKKKKNKNIKKNKNPKAISGVGKTKNKPKTVKRDKGKPRDNGKPRQVRL